MKLGGPATLVTLLLFALFGPAAVADTPGKIVLSDEENILFSEGFANAPDTVTLVQNVAAYFAGGTPGTFHAYSNEYEAPELAVAMAAAGHSWSIGFGIPMDLETLLTFDAIFLAQDTFDNQVLIDYVNAGGSVYIAGGSRGDPAEEAGQWAIFLNAFGLALNPNQYNGLAGVIPIDGSHEILQGVAGLHHQNGQDVIVLNPSNPTTTIAATFNGHNLFAVFDPGEEIVGGSVTGVSPNFVQCRNLSTGQRIVVPLGGVTSWDCEAHGLTVQPGQTVQMLLRGRAE